MWRICAGTFFSSLFFFLVCTPCLAGGEPGCREVGVYLGLCMVVPAGGWLSGWVSVFGLVWCVGEVRCFGGFCVIARRAVGVFGSCLPFSCVVPIAVLCCAF